MSLSRKLVDMAQTVDHVHILSQVSKLAPNIGVRSDSSSMQGLNQVG